LAVQEREGRVRRERGKKGKGGARPRARTPSPLCLTGEKGETRGGGGGKRGRKKRCSSISPGIKAQRRGETEGKGKKEGRARFFFSTRGC